MEGPWGIIYTQPNMVSIVLNKTIGFDIRVVPEWWNKGMRPAGISSYRRYPCGAY